MKEQSFSDDGTTRPTGVTRAADLIAANAEGEWSTAARGAWDLGDANQPPALLYNDYDGAGVGIDYCTLFARANTPCGTLIPGQRTTTTPQAGIGTGDIQLARGDTANGVTANILLPASITVDGNTLDLVWSVRHDPEVSDASRVTINNGILLVDADRRASTRRIILRAMSGDTLVNDYTLRIIEGSGGLPNPGLRFTNTVDTLTRTATHDFAATSQSGEAIMYSVSDGTLAGIDSNGLLTAMQAGTVQVIATVAEESGTWRGATVQHTLTITLLPAQLAFDSTVDILRSGGTHSFAATSQSGAAVNYSVSDAALASIDGNGLLTARAAGTVEVTATVAQSGNYSGDTISHTVTIRRRPANLALTAPPASLLTGQTVQFSATRDGTGAITWSIVEGGASARIDARTGLLTANVGRSR